VLPFPGVLAAVISPPSQIGQLAADGEIPCHLMKANAIERMRRSLEWARKSQQEWRSAYERAVDAGFMQSADLAAKQLAMFDQIVERYGNWLKKYDDDSN
jgi:hypothetical protein